MAEETEGWSASKAGKRVLHERYIALWCATIFVGLVAYYNYQNAHLVELVSFTATITSLILAILAIVYAVYSGSEMDKSLVQLAASAQLTQQMNSDALKSFQSLNEEMKDLHKTVRESHEYIRSLGGQLLGDNRGGTIPVSSTPVANTVFSGASFGGEGALAEGTHGTHGTHGTDPKTGEP